MASTWISRTNGSAPTSAYKYTVSLWIKRSQISSRSHFVRVINPSATTYYMYFEFQADDKLHFYDTNSNGGLDRVTNNLLRDVNGWYHVMAVVDTTQATASNRVKLYVNGEEPSYASTTHTNGQNTAVVGNENGKTFYIGADGSVPTRYFSGSISHFHFCDGYAYSPSDFGSTDSTTGEWKINTSPSVTYGNNGFFVLKDGNSVTDQSGNSNNFTVANGTLTKTEDCPSNVFATWNPLNVNTTYPPVYANGNTDIDSHNNTGNFQGSSTLGMTSGKFYMEIKAKSNGHNMLGVSYDAQDDARTGWYPGKYSWSWGYYEADGEVLNNNANVGGSFASYTSGDIIGIAINLDDLQGGLNKLYFSKNGVWQNSADPSNHSSTTGVVGITANQTYFFCCGDASNASSSKSTANFGNGYFGTTAVSSAGSNASNNGIFEYDVPTGFTALSTKGLNL